MVGTPIKHAQMAVLRDVGEDNIFDDIATGMSVRKLVAKIVFVNRAFYHWLNDEPGRKARYDVSSLQVSQYATRRGYDNDVRLEPPRSL